MASKKLGFTIFIAVVALIVIATTLSTLHRHGPPSTVAAWSGFLLGVVIFAIVWFIVRYYERRPEIVKGEMLIWTLLALGLVGLVAAISGEAAGSLAVMAWVFVLAWDFYMLAMVLLLVLRSFRRREQASE